jgi:hypothetical protein
MNGKIGHKSVCLYKKEREVRIGTKSAGMKYDTPGTPDIYIRLF